MRAARNVRVAQRAVASPVALSAALAHRNDSPRPARCRLLVLAALALALGVGALWSGWPADAWPQAAQVLARITRWQEAPLAPVAVLAAFVLGGLVLFPVSLSIAATIIVFGPLPGAAYALAGSLLSASVVHELGRLIPADAALPWTGARGERLRQRIVGGGAAPVAVVRLLPIAPFSVVSFVSGVARIRRGDHCVGTALGMLPGIAMYALFVDRARAVLRDSSPLTWLALLATLMVAVAVVLSARVTYRRRGAR